MPEAKNKYSVDYLFYKNIINPIACRICFINPNLITILGCLLSVPVCYNILYSKDINICFLLFFLRAFFDCLDGSIARQCNRQTKLGGLLDILSDSIFIFFWISTVIYKLLSNGNKFINYFLIVILIYGILIINKHLFMEIKNNRKYTKLEQFIHDNTLILLPLFGSFLKWYIN